MILIVEDNVHEQFALAALLSSFEYESKAVSSAEEALNLVHTETFSAVLMDVALPGMSGIACTAELKNLENFSAPIIGLTSSVNQWDKDAAMKAGMTAYMTKPFDSEELRKILLRYVYNAGDPHLKTLKPLAVTPAHSV